MLFNPAVIAFEPFSISVIATGIVTTLFGFFVTVRAQGSRIGWWYFFFAATVGLYAVGVGLSYAVVPTELSLFWDRVGHIGVAALPLAFYGTSIEVLGRTHRSTLIKRVVAVVMAVHLAAVWGTDLVLIGSYRAPWGQFSEYGPVGITFLLFSGLVISYVLVQYIREYRRQSDPIDRRRLTWQIVATVISYIAFIDVLPALGVDIYPLGYIPLAFFAVATGVAIFRFRMVDITPEMAAATVLNTLCSTVMVVDRRNVIRIANDRAHEVLGWRPPELVNRNLHEVAESMEMVADEIVPENTFFRDVERAWVLADGREIIMSISASPLTDHAGREIGVVYVGHDIADRKVAEQELERLALYDDLTGLPNRKLFFDRFEVMLTTAHREKKLSGLIYLDLNGFKNINDTYGHQAGDTVLRITAQRLRSTMRDSDTVARIGGDEFVVLCADLRRPDDLSLLVTKTRHALNEPISLEQDGQIVTVRIGAGIGTAIFPTESEDRDELLRLADSRMYQDKQGKSKPALQKDI